MSEKNIILTARIASMLLTPFYLPVLGILAIFIFSYLSMFPWQVKLSLVVMVYLFTVLIPTVLIHLYRQYHGWSLLQLGQKRTQNGALCYFHNLLFRLFLSYESITYAASDNFYLDCSVSNSDSLCHYKCVVENIYTHSSHRRCAWSTTCFLVYVKL